MCAEIAVYKKIVHFKLKFDWAESFNKLIYIIHLAFNLVNVFLVIFLVYCVANIADHKSKFDRFSFSTKSLSTKKGIRFQSFVILRLLLQIIINFFFHFLVK